MAEYAYDMIAQPWRKDPYYVASGQRKERVEVVASNDAEAFTETRKLLPTINDAYYWRLWVNKRTDLRILAARTKEEKS
ncbi:hypothetical protein [Microbacterium sp. MYb64]|uniref:hypothetical protein n=1 Tax=Microbacterium sp. MYb64 TaxID=1848691 RepID=UPI000CFB5355|nr:hypothetical protein [Microbacterium sp. MYb64]PRB01776.1 hypothetical protein CQ044_16645 [Microbacterium sp. MYb64]